MTSGTDIPRPAAIAAAPAPPAKRPPPSVGLLSYASTTITALETSRGAWLLMEIGGMIGGIVVIGILLHMRGSLSGTTFWYWPFELMALMFGASALIAPVMGLVLIVGGYVLGMSVGAQFALMLGWKIRRWLSVLLGMTVGWSAALVVLIIVNFQFDIGESCLIIAGPMFVGGLLGLALLPVVHGFDRTCRWPVIAALLAGIVAAIVFVVPGGLPSDGKLAVSILVVAATGCLGAWFGALIRGRPRLGN